MDAMSSEDRGDPPFVFPDEKPRPGDIDADGDVIGYVDATKGWEYKKAKKLEHNDIWHPRDGSRPMHPLPSIKILALRGE